MLDFIWMGFAELWGAGNPPWKARGRWFSIPGRDIFILNFSLASRSSQLGGAHANEIKHGHSPAGYVVLDHIYD